MLFHAVCSFCDTRGFLVKAFSSSDYEAFFFMDPWTPETAPRGAQRRPPRHVGRAVLRIARGSAPPSSSTRLAAQEFDSTPVRPFWLDQFYAEVFHYPSTAIRGSRYRGDSWDNFLHAILESLLYHINGNAIYFLKHPWLSFLAQKLQDSMGQLVSGHEDPYRDDSLLVGNYANTLLNTSFTEFCDSWTLAALHSGSFEACDFHGPSADDYIAWLISVDRAFQYVPKNKERVGWRPWTILASPHPPDLRNCSVYNESDSLARQQSIKEREHAHPRQSTPNSMTTDSSSCSGLLYGQFCQVSCSYGFEGQASQYRCVDGVLQGQVPNCVRKTCEIPTSLQAAEGVSSAACAGVLHGQSCISTCNEGFTGTASQLRCEDGQLEGLPPICTGLVCSLEGIVIGPGLDASACTGLRTSESCALRCRHGYTPIGDPHLTCQPDRRLSAQNSEPGTFSCVPSACGDLSKVPSFGANFIDHSCDGRVFGEVCSAFCHIGWRIEGNASVIVCDVVDNESQGFVQYFESNGSHMPVQQTAGPRCVPVECTEGLPDMKGVVHDFLPRLAAVGIVLPQLPAETLWRYLRSDLRHGLLPHLLGDSVPLHGHVRRRGREPNSSSLPSCEPQRCVGLPQATSGPFTDNCSGLAFLDHCDLRCAEGYAANGTETDRAPALRYHCGSDGLAEAEGTQPRCDLVTCNASFSIPGVLNTCEEVPVNGSCYAFCALGYRLEGQAQRWKCERSETPPIHDQNDGITLRGYLPVCLLEFCSYNIPWSPRFSHNCNDVMTWKSCEVQCAAGFVGGRSSLLCQPDGALMGPLPDCQEESVTSTTVTVYTSTETATATVLFFIFANFTMAALCVMICPPGPPSEDDIENSLKRSNVEGLLSHPLAEEGFANGIAEIFQLMPNQIEITVQEPSSSVLRISCNASSVSEWRSLLEELTVEQAAGGKGKPLIKMFVSTFRWTWP
eukprot:g10947.t1